MIFYRVERKYVQIPVTATLADGDPATLTGVDVAVLPARETPGVDTQWIAADYSNGVATVLMAGPLADPTGAIALPDGVGVDIFIRDTDTPEITVAKAGHISIA